MTDENENIYTLYDDQPNPFEMSDEEYEKALEEYHKKIEAENKKLEAWRKSNS